MTFKNTLRNIVASTVIGAGALLGTADKAEATATISMQQFDPHPYSDTWDVTAYIRNDTGNVLNEAKLDYSDLLGQIANLPHNIATYSNDGNSSNNLSDFITGATTDHLLGAGIGPLDNQKLGWYADIDETGNVNVDKDDLIPGITYVYWDDGRTKEVNLDIAKTLLNGYSLELDQNRLIPNMASAQRTSMNIYTDDGFAVNVVPEPTSAALLLTGLGALATYRKKEE